MFIKYQTKQFDDTKHEVIKFLKKLVFFCKPVILSYHILHVVFTSRLEATDRETDSLLLNAVGKKDLRLMISSTKKSSK